MHNLWFFQKSLFPENYILIAAINLTTWGPLYTCLVVQLNIKGNHMYSPHRHRVRYAAHGIHQ